LQVRGDTSRARDFTVPALGFAGGAGAAAPGFVQLQHGAMGHAGMGQQHQQHQQQQAALMGMMGMPGMQGMMGMPGMQAMMGGAMAGAMGAGMGGDDTPVVLVSNLNADVVTPADLQVLFGVYGDVHRVKILFNKKDTALVQFANSAQV
jgi:polypyrimidine tract-binding protein 3